MLEILLTGGGGYVGSALSQCLKDRCIVRPLSIRADSVSGVQFDGESAVIHLGGIAHSRSAHSDAEILEANAILPIKLALKAKKSGVKKFIFLSSTAVYGMPSLPVHETACCNPCDIYGRAKLLADDMLLQLSDDEFKVVILRAPMIYGKGAPGNPRHLMLAMRRFGFLPLAGINNRRSFLFVENLVLVVRKCLQTDLNGVFCVADDRAISTSQLVRVLAHLEGVNGRLIRMPILPNFLHKMLPATYWKIFGDAVVDNCAIKDALGIAELPTPGSQRILRR